ncbi:MAG: cation-transporting P-type ATPase, partial [Verrucomicrobiota bacterium]
MQDTATLPDQHALPVGACCHDASEPGVGVQVQTWARTWLKVAIALVIAGQAMVFSLGFNTADPRPEYGSMPYNLLNGGLAFSALLVVLLLGLPLFRETYGALRVGKLTVEALFTLTLLGAFAGSLLSSLTGTGDLYYEVVAIVLVIYTIGKTLGARSRAQALEAAARLRTDYDQAWVASCCAEGRKRVSVAELQPGAEVIVAPGEPITVDGVIVQGEGFVAETAINGETAPAKLGPGDRVYAGSFAVDASLTIRNETAAGERRLDGILTTIEAARLRPSALQAQADRLTRGFVPCVLILSALTFFGWLAQASW